MDIRLCDVRARTVSQDKVIACLKLKPAGSSRECYKNECCRERKGKNGCGGERAGCPGDLCECKL